MNICLACSLQYIIMRTYYIGGALKTIKIHLYTCTIYTRPDYAIRVPYLKPGAVVTRTFHNILRGVQIILYIYYYCLPSTRIGIDHT